MNTGLVIGVLISSVVGLGAGFWLGRLSARPQAKPPKQDNDPSFMEVINVLTGLRPDTRDYLGEMITALALAQMGKAREVPSEILLQLISGFVAQLERKLGLGPVVKIGTSGKEWVVDYDPDRHLSSGKATRGMQVSVQDPGWQIRRGNGVVQVIKRARVRSHE